MTIFPKTVAADIQAAIVEELSADEFLSSVPVYAENRKDIEFCVKNALGRQGVVAVVMTPELKYAGTYGRKSLAWEATDLEIDCVENPTVNRGRLSGDVMTGQDYVMRAFDVLCPLSGDRVGRFCPVDYRQGEDGGLLVNRGRLKCLAHLVPEEPEPDTRTTKVVYRDGTSAEYEISGVVDSGSIPNWDGAVDIAFGNLVTGFRESGFWQNSSVTAVSIPDSVTEIGHGVFEDCGNLSRMTIPNSVTSIGFHALGGTGLTSVELPDGLVDIGEGAFSGCNALSGVTIPNSVTSIGDRAFSICQALSSVTIGDSVESIGQNAFWMCYSLGAVTIPKSVTSIGRNAFWRDATYIDIFFEDRYLHEAQGMANRPWGSSTWNRLRASYGTDVVLRLENGAVQYFELAGEWAQGRLPFVDSAVEIIVGSNVTSLGSSVFWNCWKMKSVTMSDRTARIGDSAFSDASGLESLETGATTIDRAAFQLMLDLRRLKFRNRVASMGSEALEYAGEGKLVAEFPMTKAEVQALANYPWAAPSGTTFSCADGEILIP